MPFQEIELQHLNVNRANDRHGELENETAAISELFRLREAHMKKLAADIVSERAIYDPPLVTEENGSYLVFDGNRRITCMKLIHAPERAPTQELQTYFLGLRENWQGELPTTIQCQVENDRDVVDAILFRRHTGSQEGVGQSHWDDRAKRNFVERTGRGGRVNVADEVEAILTAEERLPDHRIPRSTMNRLLSSEANRQRVGISVHQNQFRLTHQRATVVEALSRIANDLANGRVVLGDLWDNRGKLSYLNRLETKHVLPAENSRLAESEETPPRQTRRTQARGRTAAQQTAFIPVDGPEIPWRADQARTRAIWEELQSLRIDHYPNAISAMVRILLELAVDDYAQNRELRQENDLSRKVRIVADDLLAREIIDQQYHDELQRIRRHDELISIRSMQRYVHSPEFAPLPRELLTYWGRLGRFVSAALSH